MLKQKRLPSFFKRESTMRGVGTKQIHKIAGGIVQCNYAYCPLCSLILRKFYSEQSVMPAPPPPHPVIHLPRRRGSFLLGSAERMEAGGEWEERRG